MTRRGLDVRVSAGGMRSIEHCASHLITRCCFGWRRETRAAGQLGGARDWAAASLAGQADRDRTTIWCGRIRICVGGLDPSGSKTVYEERVPWEDVVSADRRTRGLWIALRGFRSGCCAG